MNIKKSDLTKAKILSAAIVEFSKSGLEGTSLGTIAKRAESSPPLILYHFQNLDQLFLAAVTEVTNRGFQRIAQYSAGLSDRLDLLDAYISALVDWIGDNKENGILFVQFYHHASTKEAYRKINNDIVIAGQQRIQKLLPDNDFHKSLLIQDLITGCLIRHITNDHESSIYQLRKRLKAAVQLVVDWDSSN